MGAAIAEAARDRGAAVTLIAGAMSVTPPRGVTVVDATTAQAMREAVLRAAPDADILVMAAAVADFAPGARQPAQDQALRREPPDRAGPEPRHRRRGRRDARRRAPVPHRLRRRVATTSRPTPPAKLRDKGLDLIVGNVVGGPFDAIGSDENKVTVFGAEGALTDWPMLPKRQVAERLWDLIGDRYRRARPADGRRPRPAGGAAGRDRRPPHGRAARRDPRAPDRRRQRRLRADHGHAPRRPALARAARARRERLRRRLALRQPGRLHARSTRPSTGARDQARDLALLEHAEADIAFLPEVGTLYPPDDTTRVTVEGLTRQLEGASRPGHLDGLTTVMLKLIHLVGPARLYLGQRHAQQVVIVRRMLRDLFINVELVVCPTVRDDDGLALSSANAQLGDRGAPRGRPACTPRSTPPRTPTTPASARPRCCAGG